MSPARDQHNEFVYEITAHLNQRFKGRNLTAKFDTFRYLDDWLINAFGDFNNMVGMEKFINGLKRFGASAKFIQERIDEYSASGSISPGYAPDVLVVEKSERHNRFSIPLLTCEIVSDSSRQHDLYFMPYFYETIGVREFFIGETEEETGKIVRGYRLTDGQYRPIMPEPEGYYSEVAGEVLSRVWQL